MVRETVAEYGLKQIGAYRDLPDDRDIRFSGPGGSALMFGTFKAAVLSIQTPCRLPAGPPAPISPPKPADGVAREGAHTHADYPRMGDRVGPDGEKTLRVSGYLMARILAGLPP